MPKHKVSELEGARLDLAVALALGIKWVPYEDREDDGTLLTPPGNTVWQHPDTKNICVNALGHLGRWEPSTDWGTGGPIIEREQIELTHDRGYFEDGSFGRIWQARLVVSYWDGDTPLIAAMRAHVADKYGEEIELPDISA